MSRQKRVLVTGVSGFTGRHLAHRLIASGHEVHGLIRATSYLNGLSKAPVRLHEGDLLDPESIDRAVAGMDVVYHVAASFRNAGLSSEIYRATNVEGTRHVMEAAARHKVPRIVHCSTVGVHGHVDNPPGSEDSPFSPGDFYQETKLEGERLVQRMISNGFPATIARPVGIYGPGDVRFLKLFRSVKKGTFVMFGNGRALYQFTYIDDVVNGLIACGENDKAVGRTYIVAGFPAVSLNEMIAHLSKALGVKEPRLRLPFGVLWGASLACEAVCRPLGIPPPLFRRRADWFRKDRSFSGERIQRELGFEPSVTLEDGFQRTANWYQTEAMI